MKKIFALVLSLCIVLSTFVAVSAQEQVFVEGNVRALFNINNDFDVADPAVLKASGITADYVTDPKGLRSGKVYGGEITDASKGFIGVKLPVNSISVGDVVEISLDVYSSAEWQAGASNVQGVMLRAGNEWAPANDYVQVLKNETVPANTWTTLTNTFTFTKDVSGAGIWLQIRPNVKLDYFYIDNLRFSIKTPTVIVASGSTDCDTKENGLLEKGGAGAINNVETVGGRTYINAHVGATGSDQVGFRIKTADGSLFVAPEDGDVLTFSMDINPEEELVLDGSSYKSIILRQGDNTAFPGTGEFLPMFTYGTIPANQWTTVTGTYVFTKAWGTSRGNPNKAISLGIRSGKSVDIKIDNVSYQVARKAASKVDDDWAAPDYTIPSTAVKSDKYPFITEADGAFSFTTADVAAKVASDAWSSQFCLMIKFDEPIARDADFKVVYDLKTSGVLNSAGAPYAEMDVSARAVDNTAEINNSHTIGYIYAKAPVNTEDANTIVLDSAKMTAGGGTSSSDTIAAICLVINMNGACLGYNNAANDGSLTFSNIAVMNPDTKIALSADKTANGVELTLTNANAEKYKFAGRLLAAEYEVVDGVKKLVQFTEVAVDEKIEAGSEAVVTAEFEGAIAAGNQVYVFVWEPASFDAITMFIK